MAFFKFRKGGDEQSAAAPQPESVEVLRRRAKNRLIGATILVAIGIIGFPLLVDRQPRPLVVDVPIDIPDKNHVQPLSAPADAASASAASAVAGTVVEDAPVAPAATSAPVAPASAAAVKAVPVAPVAKAPVAVASGPAASGKVQAAKTDSRSTDGRYVVQVGSFADEGHARDARAKLERAGLKNYTQVADTKDGKRIRVRAGPFASKAEAERAAERIKKLDLPAALLTL